MFAMKKNQDAQRRKFSVDSEAIEGPLRFGVS